MKDCCKEQVQANLWFSAYVNLMIFWLAVYYFALYRNLWVAFGIMLGTVLSGVVIGEWI